MKQTKTTTDQSSTYQPANQSGTFFQRWGTAMYEAEHSGDFTPHDIEVLRKDPGVRAIARGTASGALGGAAAGVFFGPGAAVGAASGAIYGAVAAGVDYVLTPSSK